MMEPTALVLSEPALLTTDARSERFGFQALGLLSAIATADGVLLWNEYRDFHRFAKSLLSERELASAPARAAALRLFLPHSETELRLTKVLEAAQKERVSTQVRARLVEHVLEVLEGSPQRNSAGMLLARRLVDGLKVPLAPYAERLDRLSAQVAREEQADTPAEGGKLQNLTARLKGAFSKLTQRTRPAPNPTALTFTRPPELESAEEFANQVLLLGRTIQNHPSDVPARKEKFVSSKMEKARKGLDAFEAQIRTGIEQYYQGIWQSFMTSVKDRYLPLLAEVQASVEEARLRHQLHLRIREDTLRLVDELAALPAPAR